MDDIEGQSGRRLSSARLDEMGRQVEELSLSLDNDSNDLALRNMILTLAEAQTKTLTAIAAGAIDERELMKASLVEAANALVDLTKRLREAVEAGQKKIAEQRRLLETIKSEIKDGK